MWSIKLKSEMLNLKIYIFKCIEGGSAIGNNFLLVMSIVYIMSETDCPQINVWSEKWVEIQIKVKSLFLTTEKLPRFT